MRSDDKITWLRDSLGANRSIKDAATLASLGDRVSVPAGTTLARTGDLGREAFVIMAGRVEVRRDGDVVAVLGRGDVAGELAVTTATRRNADLVTITDVELVVFDGRSFRSAMALSDSLHHQVATAQQTRIVA